MTQFASFTAAASSPAFKIEGQYWTAQLLGVADSGNVTGTVVIEATNTPGDSGSWQTLDTLAITGATPQRDFGSGGPIGWADMRFRCTAITGTNAVLRLAFNAQ